MSLPLNAWDYKIRVDCVARDQIASLSADFPEIEIFDPKKRIECVTTDGARERFLRRWPDLDAIRIIIPITHQKSKDIIERLGKYSFDKERIDVILGLRLENDTEYCTVPKSVSEIVHAIGCDITVNVTGGLGH
jgi:hypothetical protein